MNPFAHAALIALFCYALLLGGTYSGLLLPELRALSMLLLTLAFIGWLVLRQKRRWHWHGSPLDWAIFFWIVAFVASLQVNQNVWRRSAMGLWYVALYVGIWYILFDMQANRFFRRRQLADAVMVGGVVVLIFGLLELRPWLTVQLPLMMVGALPLQLPGPGGPFNDPGLLGGFLVVLIPLSLGMMAIRQGLGRLISGLMAIAGVVLILLTYSRGAWGALLVATLVQVAPTLSRQGILDSQRFLNWWERRSRLVRSELSTTALLSVLLLFIIGFLMFYSLRGNTRSAGLRTNIYGSAITLFSERPIVGYGIFTFGRGLARLQSLPPYVPHNHAHSLPLHVAAELGLVGLGALAFLAYQIGRTMRDNWQAEPVQQRVMLMGAIAAVAGFASYQMIDMPLMNPAVALTGIVPLLMALYSPHKVLRVGGAGGRIGVALVAFLWLGLLATGWWSTLVYVRYASILDQARREQNFFSSAEQLQSVIDADPAMAIYYQQQGFLYGMAATGENSEALTRAIAAYERFVELEPDYAVGWANLAALYRQAGELEHAIATQRKAVEHAPDAWQFAFTLGAYLEETGDDIGAWRAYRQAVLDDAQIVLLPAWQETALRREFVANTRLGDFARTIQAWERGDADAARAIRQESDYANRSESRVYVLDALIALLEGDIDTAEAALEAAAAVANSAEAGAWVDYGNAEMAAYRGDNMGASELLASARQRLTPGLLGTDYAAGINIPNLQFFRMAIPRQFLPQVYYPTADPVLLSLLQGGIQSPWRAES